MAMRLTVVKAEKARAELEVKVEKEVNDLWCRKTEEAQKEEEQIRKREAATMLKGE